MGMREEALVRASGTVAMKRMPRLWARQGLGQWLLPSLWTVSQCPMHYSQRLQPRQAAQSWPVLCVWEAPVSPGHCWVWPVAPETQRQRNLHP